MEKLDVLYEDNQIIVVIKPQNVPTMSDESKDDLFLEQCSQENIAATREQQRLFSGSSTTNV